MIFNDARLRTWTGRNFKFHILGQWNNFGRVSGVGIYIEKVTYASPVYRSTCQAFVYFRRRVSAKLTLPSNVFSYFNAF